MERLAIFGLAVLVGVACFAAEPSKDVVEARRQFLKEFKHRGMDTTKGDAMLLRILIESGKYKRGVEIGAYHGHGAINMGMALEKNGGQLFSLEIDPEAVRISRENVKKVGLEKTVTMVEGDALKTIPTLEGEFDFVFIDAVKKDYLKYLQGLLPKLKPGALIVADNVIRSAAQMQDYLEHVQNEENYDTVIVRASMDKNDGMAISYKLK